MAGIILSHSRQQGSIGQGFFHTGEVVLGEKRFDYIYDCGSENGKPLRREILDYLNRTKRDCIDALFISHLDADHVNGLDQLLGRLKVKTVFLPYLAAIERIVLAVNAVQSGNASATFILFISDPTRWFADRSVEEVIYIIGDEDGGISDDNVMPQFPDPSTQLPTSIESMTLDLEKMRHTPDKFRGEKKRNSGIDPFQRDHTSRNRKNVATRGSALPHQIPFVISPGIGFYLNWMFLAFVHPDLSRRERFLDALHQEFPNTHLQSRPLKLGKVPIQDVLRDPSMRSRLARCYSAKSSVRNLTSMSLYSGPLTTANCSILYACSRGFHVGTQCGWIGTGDSDLKDVVRRTAFLKHYQQLLPRVVTMALPHHGSRHSFDDALVQPNLWHYVASAGRRNRHGHPHKEVCTAITKRHRILIRSSENIHSRFHEEVKISVP